MLGRHQRRRLLPARSAEVSPRTVLRAAARLRYLSSHDPITRLPNRGFFKKRLARILKLNRAGNRSFALIFLSVDAYRRINETLGPAESDRLMRYVARRLEKILGAGTLVGHWVGDEFVILLDDIETVRQAVEISVKVQQQLEMPFLSGPHEFHLSSSVGLAVYPLHGSSVETVLRNAAAALLRAKACGGGNYRLYNAAMNARALQRLALESSLRRALSRNELTVYYQPQLATGTWRVIAAEALVRWNHPEFGLLLPSEFIPLAEETGLIVGIGQWVLRTACTQLRKWHMEGFKDLGIAVNISAREFHTADPADSIIRTLDDVGLDPRHLTLELTESWLMTDVEPVVRSLTRLGDAGVTLSIDDFGTGFCSFEYLRRMPLHNLKIDETFVRNAATNADDAAMVTALISLAHRLRLKVIAEGLENQEQVELLERLNCDAMQGFIFAKPMPANQFEGLLVRTASKPKDVLSKVWQTPRSEISPRTWKAALSSGAV